MAEAILERIPAEKRWEMAAQSFANGCMGYIQVLLGIIGKEKLAEIESKMWSEGMRLSFQTFIKELNMPIEDAIDAANLMGVFAFLSLGPNCKMERVEESRNRVVDRYLNCPWWESAKQFGIADQYECSCPDWGGAALKAINPKLIVTCTKTQSRARVRLRTALFERTKRRGLFIFFLKLLSFLYLLFEFICLLFFT